MNAADVRVPAQVEHLRPWVEAGVLGAAEVHLAGWAVRAAAHDDPLVALGVAFAAWAAHHGHACADLSVLGRVVIAEHVRDDDAAPRLPWPEPGAWLAGLRAAPAVVRQAAGCDPHVVADPRPVVLHGHRLYLQRYWMDECAVIASLRERAAAASAPLGSATPEAMLDTLLPAVVDGDVNVQRLAAHTVLQHRVSLLVGGPGTGKTYSVARLLAAMLRDQPDLRVGLAAPTGKAAARLQESIATSLTDPVVQAAVPDDARAVLAAARPTTIHRLLGSLGMHRQRFRHGPDRLLPHDVVVVDETSMVSLPILARLLEAVRPDARVVLIGDPDQLESVDLGAVLRDLVDVAVEHPAGPLAGHGTRLVRGHRFGGDTPIARLAEAIRRGDDAAAIAILRAAPAPSAASSAAQGSGAAVAASAATTSARSPSALASDRDGVGAPSVAAESSGGRAAQLSLFGDHTTEGPHVGATTAAAGSTDETDTSTFPAQPTHLADAGDLADGGVRFLATVDPLAAPVVAAVRSVVEPVVQRMRAAAEAGDADGALDAVAALRVLCAHRHGAFGVTEWNRLVEGWAFGPGGAGAVWFAGRPLLATRNDARLGLANGDTGVVVRQAGRLVAVFDTALGRRPFEPVQLEAVDTAFAMTIHKSQGSEYGTVVMVLPPHGSPLVGRELLYTGATRARGVLHVVGSEAAFTACVRAPAERMTGLADGLRA